MTSKGISNGAYVFPITQTLSNIYAPNGLNQIITSSGAGGALLYDGNNQWQIIASSGAGRINGRINRVRVN